MNVKDLPAPIRDALKSVRYGRESIAVHASATVQLGGRGSGDGQRAFTTLVALDTGEYRTVRGSWGGPNMFVTTPVDTDGNEYALPPNGVAILGTEGGSHPVYATLHIPASMVSRILTAGPAEELPQVEKDALYAHKGIKGGEHRREFLRRKRVPSSVVDGLVSRGLLKRNSAGATSITTAGRNALGTYYTF